MTPEPSSPVEAGGHFAVARLPDRFYIACTSRELGSRPLARRLHGVPIVLFRGAGGAPTALLDRCAHRNVPLSAGRCDRGEIECPYHGWRFDAAGVCHRVPALVGAQEGKARRVPVLAVREQQGYVWVYGRADVTPTSEPYVFPRLGERGWAAVRYDRPLESTVYNALENALDVPHTAFLHRGLFRGGESHRIRALVRRIDGGVEAEYVGEPRPSGVLARLLAPGGGTVRHFDRFLLPSIAQVEYALGPRSQIVVTSVLTPVDDFHSHMYAVGVLRLPFGATLATLLLAPVARRVVAQDAAILALQSRRTRELGGEQFASTDVDVLGPEILRLLRQAERGEVAPPGSRAEREVELDT